MRLQFQQGQQRLMPAGSGGVFPARTISVSTECSVCRPASTTSRRNRRGRRFIADRRRRRPGRGPGSAQRLRANVLSRHSRREHRPKNHRWNRADAQRNQHCPSAYAACDDQRRCRGCARTTVQSWISSDDAARGASRLEAAAEDLLARTARLRLRTSRRGSTRCERTLRGTRPGRARLRRRRTSPSRSSRSMAKMSPTCGSRRYCRSPSAAACHLTMPVPRNR